MIVRFLWVRSFVASFIQACHNWGTGGVECPKDVSDVLSRQLLLKQLWMISALCEASSECSSKIPPKETEMSNSLWGHYLDMFSHSPKTNIERNKNLHRKWAQKDWELSKNKTSGARRHPCITKTRFYLVAQREMEKRVRKKDSV